MAYPELYIKYNPIPIKNNDEILFNNNLEAGRVS